MRNEKTPLVPMAPPATFRTGVALDLTEDGCPQSPGDIIPDALPPV